MRERGEKEGGERPPVAVVFADAISLPPTSPTSKRARTDAAPATTSTCPHPATMGGLCVACGGVVTAHVLAAAGDARADDGGVALR